MAGATGTLAPVTQGGKLMSTTDATYLRLRQLHHHYVEKVNRLVAEDREDLIPEAVSAYADEALRELAAGKAA
jgi:hypothetical protein